MHTGVWSHSSILTLHGGSTLRLLLVLAVANGSLAHSMYYPFCGFLLPFVATALPLTLLLPLASSRLLCRRLLEDASSTQAVTNLQSTLNIAQ
jgi:hypothetical protein